MPSGHAFRAQSVIRRQRELCSYWRECANARQMPSRNDFDPADIPDLLPDLSLIDVGAGLHEAVVRLAGTRLRDIYGCEITGQRLLDLDWGDQTDYWTGVYERVIGEGVPLRGNIRGPLAEREHITLFWLRLPLSDDGSRVNKILCWDAAIYEPRAQELREPPLRQAVGAGL